MPRKNALTEKSVSPFTRSNFFLVWFIKMFKLQPTEISPNSSQFTVDEVFMQSIFIQFRLIIATIIEILGST